MFLIGNQLYSFHYSLLGLGLVFSSLVGVFVVIRSFDC